VALEEEVGPVVVQDAAIKASAASREILKIRSVIALFSSDAGFASD
jgi:hypothetical protein